MIVRCRRRALAFVAVSGLGCGSTPPPAPPSSRSEPRVEAPQQQAPRAVPDSVSDSVTLIEAPPAAGESAVRFSLATSAGTVVPGGTFWLAARFDLAPGYRVFWVNPGDEGRPTRVEFHAPEGFEVSEARFPPPQRFELADSGVAYGYQAETAAAFAEVRAKPDLEASESHRFEVEASWLACEVRCFPETAAAYVELGANERAAPGEFSRELSRLRDALPTPLTELLGASYRWKRGGRLHVTAPGTEWLDFLSEHPQDPKLVEIDTKSKAGVLKLRFAEGTPGSRVQGLAMVGSKGAPRYVRVDVPWPEQALR
ncbi:MAG TPA: protein-disulfide reductase DsbD domain-containing protein [Polyangiaceae bacterium]